MTQILNIRSNQPQKTVNLTDTAVTKVGELIAAEGEEGMALRMAVRPGGCSGFSYELFFDTQIETTTSSKSSAATSGSWSIPSRPR
jgi:Fe-S cluster assembly iron-binding protein IscA